MIDQPLNWNAHFGCKQQNLPQQERSYFWQCLEQKRPIYTKLLPIILFYPMYTLQIWDNFSVSQFERALCVLQITPTTPVCNYLCVLFPSLCKAFGILDRQQQRHVLNEIQQLLEAQSRGSLKQGNEGYESLSEAKLTTRKMGKTCII